MAVTIRLARFGTRKRPTYRIVVADSRTPRDGSFMEKIGTYDPNQNPAYIHIEKEKAAKWINRGAQPTRTVRNLIKKAGSLTGMTQPEETE